MPEFSSSKIILHHFNVGNNEGKSVIGYDMIIDRNLIVHIFIQANFKCQVLKWDVDTVTIKEPSGLLGQTDLTSREMHEVVMKTVEPVSIREATDRTVKILYSNYAKADLEQVDDNSTHMNY